MKAKDLIKILKTDPQAEVKFYIDVVNDYQDIEEVANCKLTRTNPKLILEKLNQNRKEIGLDILKEISKDLVSEWSLSFSEELFSTDKEIKTCFLIKSVPRNKKAYFGTKTIHY